MQVYLYKIKISRLSLFLKPSICLNPVGYFSQLAFEPTKLITSCDRNQTQIKLQTMFENSFVTRLNLRCPIHYNSRITYACPKPTCQKNPLLCDECINSKMKQQHYGHQYELQKIDKYLQSLSNTVCHQKASIQKLYKSILSQKQNQTLLNWQKQKLQHFQSIQNHLNTLKFQIEEEIGNIIVKFEEQLNRQKENVYKQLEAYFQTYKNKFNHFTQLTEPVVLMQQSFVFYQSKNNLSLKMMSLESSKLNKWLYQLKFNLNRAELATKKQFEYINRVQNLGLVTNQLMDELPRLRNLDFETELPQIMQQSSRNILSSLISFRRPKVGPQSGNKSMNQGPPIMRSTSMNYISNQHSRTTSVNDTRDGGRQRKYVPQM